MKEEAERIRARVDRAHQETEPSTLHEQSSYILTETYTASTGPVWVWIQSSVYIY